MTARKNQAQAVIFKAILKAVLFIGCFRQWYVVADLCFAPLERGESFGGRVFYKHLAPNGAKSNNVLSHL